MDWSVVVSVVPILTALDDLGSRGLLKLVSIRCSVGQCIADVLGIERDASRKPVFFDRGLFWSKVSSACQRQMHFRAK